MDHYGWLIVIGIILILVIIIIYSIKSAAESFFSSLFNLESLFKGLDRHKELLYPNNTPKSVSSMTKIYLPQITKDFPQFNLIEFKYKAEYMLKSALLAIDTQDLSLLKDASQDLLRQVELIISQLQSRGRQESYKNIKVHMTEVTRYMKQKGTCVITLQSAVEYLHYVEENGVLVSGSHEYVEQTKYNLELLYIQNPEKVQGMGNRIGVTCPNCGAPISQLENKYCEYCGSGVMEINLHVWSLNRFYEVKN